MSARMNAGCFLPLASAALLVGLPKALSAQEPERPNILWLTFEDTSPYEWGCYGNPHAQTPTVDSLAARGIRFMQASSCGPQSSPARSTLITGCYSTTYAMDWHRGRVGTPSDIFFPQYLREAGYYCTNNKKTDYNTKVDNKACWDECGDKASYNSPARQEGQPFFAVFNSNLTHMSRLTSVHTDARRDFAAMGLDPAVLDLPPHVPDLPEVRSDYAFHIEACRQVDQWVKLFLRDLKKRGLDQNTLVFVFSDHGGCLPRGKAFAYETSFRVPMVVYVPPKWQGLFSMQPGEKCYRPVSFVDMGPTMLSLAGVKIPAYMQGLPFAGSQETEARKYQFGHMTNRTLHFVPSRTVSDGRYKYIRYYIPYKRDALFNYFQWQMPANLFWDKAYFEGRLEGVHRFPYEKAVAESFFDLQADPFELHDLAADPRYAPQVAQLREVLSQHLRETGDLGLLPLDARKGASPYARVRETGYDLESLFALAELSLSVSFADVPRLLSVLDTAQETEFAFWAVVNLAVLAQRGEALDMTVLRALRKALDSPSPMVAQEAAYALCFTSARAQGFDYLAQHPELTSALELLALEEGVRDAFPENVLQMLYRESAQFEAKPRTQMPGQGDGIYARKVLVNLGLLPPAALYGPQVYPLGLEVNQALRPLRPLP